MASTPDAFIVPAGLVFEEVDGALAIEHDGDIVLHGTLGQRIHALRSNHGDVVLNLDEIEVQEVAAPEGAVRVQGRLAADSVVGHLVEVTGDLEAGGVYADGIRVTGDLEAERAEARDGGVSVLGTARVRGALASGAGSVQLGAFEGGEIRTGAGAIHVDGDCAATAIQGGGDVEVGGHLAVDRAVAAGAMSIAGGVEAAHLRADAVRIAGPASTARVVQGATRIDVQAERVQADILIAPHCEVSERAQGRITVVECHNELGPTLVKGCLSLDDLAGILGDVGRFLEEHGIEPLDGAPAAAAEVAGEPEEDAADEPTPAGEPLPVEAEPEAARDEEAAEDDGWDDADWDLDEEAAEEPAPAEEAAAEEEIFDVSEEVDDEEPGTDEAVVDHSDEWAVGGAAEAVEVQVDEDDESVEDDWDDEPVEQPAPADDDPTYPLLAETIARITDCYAGTEMPPAVERLRGLVEERAYDRIRTDITDIWNQLLRFHQERGIRIQSQVTTTFNTINTIVRKL